MKRSKTRRKRLVITGITDMEDKPASAAMVNALASRVVTVIGELGLTARIRIGKETKVARSGARGDPRHRAVVAGPSTPLGSFEARSASVAVGRLRSGPETRMEEG